MSISADMSMQDAYKEFCSRYPLKKLCMPKSESVWSYYDINVRSENVIVFLHGICGTAGCFFYQMDFLSSLGIRIISLQYPCYSYLSDWLKNLCNILEYLNIKKAHFFASDLGGYLIQFYAKLYPSKISSLILCNSYRRTEEFANFASLRNIYGKLYTFLPHIILKKIILEQYIYSNYFQIDLKEKNALEFMSNELDIICAADLGGRISLQLSADIVDTIYVSDKSITVIQTRNNMLSDKLNDDIRKAYPKAKHALMKSGGYFPYLSRHEEVNLYISVHLRNNCSKQFVKEYMSFTMNQNNVSSVSRVHTTNNISNIANVVNVTDYEKSRNNKQYQYQRPMYDQQYYSQSTNQDLYNKKVNEYDRNNYKQNEYERNHYKQNEYDRNNYKQNEYDRNNYKQNEYDSEYDSASASVSASASEEQYIYKQKNQQQKEYKDYTISEKYGNKSDIQYNRNDYQIGTNYDHTNGDNTNYDHTNYDHTKYDEISNNVNMYDNYKDGIRNKDKNSSNNNNGEYSKNNSFFYDENKKNINYSETNNNERNYLQYNSTIQENVKKENDKNEITQQPFENIINRREYSESSKEKEQEDYADAYIQKIRESVNRNDRNSMYVYNENDYINYSSSYNNDNNNNDNYNNNNNNYNNYTNSYRNNYRNP